MMCTNSGDPQQERASPTQPSSSPGCCPAAQCAPTRFAQASAAPPRLYRRQERLWVPRAHLHVHGFLGKALLLSESRRGANLLLGKFFSTVFCSVIFFIPLHLPHPAKERTYHSKFKVSRSALEESLSGEEDIFILSHPLGALRGAHLLNHQLHGLL